MNSLRAAVSAMTLPFFVRVGYLPGPFLAGTYNSKRGGIDWDEDAFLNRPRGYESVRLEETK